MRERPPAATAIGDGELASKLSWTEREVTFSEARFALEHASGQGQAVVTLQSPRPHVRAAFALDHLDLNPFLAGNGSGGNQRKTAVMSPLARTLRRPGRPHRAQTRAATRRHRMLRKRRAGSPSPAPIRPQPPSQRRLRHRHLHRKLALMPVSPLPQTMPRRLRRQLLRRKRLSRRPPRSMPTSI